MDQSFLEHFENLIDQMVDYEHYSREKMLIVLRDTARYFHLTRVETEFYKNATDEKDGIGEITCDFDEGPADKVALHKRVTSKSGAIVKGTTYMAKDTEPLDETQLRRLDLCLRTMLALLSRNRMQNAIEQLAYHDMDGYPNFPYYYRYLERMNENGGFKDQIAMMFNIRQFSIINRDLGPAAGDRIMHGYFDAINEIIGDKGCLCHVGGDNFAAIFPADLLEPMKKAMNGLPVKYSNDDHIMVSACAGVFIIPPDFVFNRPADIAEMIFPACQSAKLEKDGRIVYASKKIVEEKENTSRVRRDFEDALANQEFQAYYQPKVDVQNGKLIGAEALCRWIKNGEVVAPAQFIPVLEQNTDICKLDFYILDQVCKNIHRWLSEGRNVVRVSVNLSRKHLLNPNLLEDIVRIIDRNKVPYKYIEIELTETTTEVDFKKMQRLVDGLQEIGISTAVDDFGSGYSSLRLVRELPWKVIKIDRSLLPGENENKRMSTLVFSHIAALAKDMGIECITEGVETAEQIEILRSNDCPFAQGFFYDKPLPLEEFEKRLDEGKY